MFYDVEEEDLLVRLSRPHAPKTSSGGRRTLLRAKDLQRNRCARRDWLVLLVSCFCLFRDSGADDRKKVSWAGQSASESADVEVGPTDKRRSHESEATEGKWLKW